MWKQRYKYYLTKDPQYVITAVSTIKTQNYFENLNKFYKIEELHNDSIFKELYAYSLLLAGYDFIPIAFSDKVSKLDKLPIVKGFLEMFWCIGYISPYFNGQNKSILKQCNREIITPSYSTLLMWLKHHVNNYTDSKHNSINQTLAKECLRKYILENVDDTIITQQRRFNLMYNNHVCFIDKFDCQDWIKHLETLSTRDLYEIIVNEFE